MSFRGITTVLFIGALSALVGWVVAHVMMLAIYDSAGPLPASQQFKGVQVSPGATFRAETGGPVTSRPDLYLAAASAPVAHAPAVSATRKPVGRITLKPVKGRHAQK